MDDHSAATIPYHELPGFDGYYFEDGWVFNIWSHGDQFEIEIDAVLAKGHPDAGPPKPGEMYRYRRVVVRFPGVLNLEWIQPLDLRGTRDPDGSIDHGNIDFFTRTGEVSRLGGSWGEVLITSDVPVVEELDRTS